MKVSRRGILAGLLATSAAPAAAVQDNKPPPVPTPKFIKGMIMPRALLMTDPRHVHAGYAQPVVYYEYEVFDGKKFVPLNSSAGQDVVREMGG